MKTFDQLTEKEKAEEVKKVEAWIAKLFSDNILASIKSGVPTEKQGKE